MIIACPACNTRYAVPDSAIGVEGRTVRCAKCRHSWFQDGPAPEAVAPPPPPRPAPPPPPPPPAAPMPVAEPEPIAREPDLPEPDRAEPPVPTPAEQEPEDIVPPPLGFAEDVLPPPTAALRVPPPAPDDGPSQFDYEPPFRPRRNPARMWTIAAALFAVVALGAVAATAWYGLPSWLPFAQPMFAEDQPGLKLDFPAKQQGRRQLPDQTWFFEANGTITNISQASRSVPPVMLVLRDGRKRVVYTAEIVPSKRVLAPGESVQVNQVMVPVPPAGTVAEFGWKPGS
ncbi:MAG: zinc-ribbon domain-containing protein [Sphingomonadales bacterium]|nr:zinc-ribbon domain-containing protein [Sphingomonadales bacterium]